MKKILSLMLVFSLLASVAPVYANVATEYNYVFGVKTGGNENGGTGDDIYMGVSTYESGVNSDQATNFGGAAAWSDTQHTFKLQNTPPWRMNELVFGWWAVMTGTVSR